MWDINIDLSNVTFWSRPLCCKKVVGQVVDGMVAQWHDGGRIIFLGLKQG